MGKDLNRHFFKEDIQMANKHIKRCLESLVIREMEIKTTMRYNFIPTTVSIIKKTGNSKHWWGCGKTGTLIHCWQDCKMVQPPWRSLTVLQNELKTYTHTKSCTQIFIAALFIIAKNGNNPNIHQLVNR